MGGASGGLCMLWSYLMHLGIGWSAMAAVITCVALDGAFAWRAYLAWSAYSQGQVWTATVTLAADKCTLCPAPIFMHDV